MHRNSTWNSQRFIRTYQERAKESGKGRRLSPEIILTDINAGHASTAIVMQAVVITASIPVGNVVVKWKYVTRQW